MKLPKELQKKPKKKGILIQTHFEYGKINVIERLANIQEELDDEFKGKTFKELIGKNSKMGFALLIVSVMDCKTSAEDKKGFIELNTILDWFDKIDDIMKLTSRETMLEYYMGLDEPEKTLLESIYERIIFEFGKDGELKNSITNFFKKILKKARELRSG
ncbi:MAG: hypothetical protein ACFFDB_00430 [Promethearchaeota archaeon]